MQVAKSRYLNVSSKFSIVRTTSCKSCASCIKACPVELQPQLCRGFECKRCIENCPQKALSLEINPILETMGDYRWPGELILATWMQAETGKLPRNLVYETGRSGGGFDAMKIKISKNCKRLDEEEISTAIQLNKRESGEQIEIPIPIYGSGMSLGSVSLQVMLARAKAAKAWNTFVSTGEGGYPDELLPYKEHIIHRSPLDYLEFARKQSNARE